MSTTNSLERGVTFSETCTKANKTGKGVCVCVHAHACARAGESNGTSRVSPGIPCKAENIIHTHQFVYQTEQPTNRLVGANFSRTISYPFKKRGKHKYNWPFPCSDTVNVASDLWVIFSANVWNFKQNWNHSLHTHISLPLPSLLCMCLGS